MEKKIVTLRSSDDTVLAQGVYEGSKEDIAATIENHIRNGHIFSVTGIYGELFPKIYVVASKIATFTIAEEKSK